MNDQDKIKEQLFLQDQILTHMAEGINFVRLADLTIIYVNPKFEEMFGYSKDELIGQHVSILNFPGKMSPKEVSEEIAERLKENGRWDGETHNIRKDGTSFWCRANVVASENPTYGKVAISVHQDITERKRAEEQLRQQRDQAHLYLDIADVIIVAIDSKGRVTLINRRGCEILGYEAHEIIGKDWFDHFLPARVRTEVRGVSHGVLDGKIELFRSYENSVLTKSGQERLIFWHTVTLTDAAGNITGHLSSGEDVTERKRAEEKIKENEEKLRSIVENSSDQIFMLDKDCKFLSINKTAADIFKKSPQEMIGTSIFAIFPEDTAVRFSKNIKNVFDTGKGMFIEEKMIAQGREFYNSTGLNPVKNDKGDVIAATGIVRDITEHKRIEEELRQSHEQLRNLSTYIESAREEERVSLAREIHDELGQVLTALQIDLSLLSDELTAEQEPLRRKLQATSDRIAQTIEVVRRISSELRPAVLDDLGFVAALEWQAGEFQNRTRISCKLSLEVPELAMSTQDATACFRIFQEALTNIARHSEATKVIINLRQKAGKIILEIKDNGKGITEEQLNNPRSFGLIGMRERVHSIGAQLKITGKPNRGTIVTLTLPQR